MVRDWAVPSTRDRATSLRSRRVGATTSESVAPFEGALAAVLVNGACLPAPHWRMIAPEVQGRVESEGRPLRGQRLGVTTTFQRVGERCRAPTIVVSTDEDGRFRIAPIHKFERFFFVVGETFDSWALCAYIDGSWTAVWRQHRPEFRTVRLTCNDEQRGAPFACQQEQ